VEKRRDGTAVVVPPEPHLAYGTGGYFSAAVPDGVDRATQGDPQGLVLAGASHSVAIACPPFVDQIIDVPLGEKWTAMLSCSDIPLFAFASPLS
jgi:hypothetical protein